MARVCLSKKLGEIQGACYQGDGLRREHDHTWPYNQGMGTGNASTVNVWMRYGLDWR